MICELLFFLLYTRSTGEREELVKKVVGRTAEFIRVYFLILSNWERGGAKREDGRERSTSSELCFLLATYIKVGGEGGRES